MCFVCEENAAKGLGRRQFLGFAGIVAGTAALGLSAGQVAADECAPFLAEAQTAATPDQALQFLIDGNARFAAGASLNCDLLGQMKATSKSQTPFACVLGCIDSRAAPELVFDQQIGDMFVGRVAGNVATDEIIGSFEFATKAAGAKLIVVMGHNSCGAIKGAVDKAVLGDNLTTLLDEIEPSIAATPLEGERASSNHAFVEAVAETNVRMAVAAMTERSPVIKELVDAGTVKVVGALYDIETGVVRFLA